MVLFAKKPRLPHLLSASLLSLGGLASMDAANAGNMYVFKDSNGQVLLTNVVSNNRPAGNNFQNFTKKVKVTYYADTNVHSYSNWGANEAAVPASARGNKNSYDSMIVASALRHGVDPALMKAMMHTESGFNPNARSPVGAQGLMQLMPGTAKRFGVQNSFDIKQNIEGGVRYLKYLGTLFPDDPKLAIAAYNAGELYVNFHTEMNQGGELRGQLMGGMAGM